MTHVVVAAAVEVGSQDAGRAERVELGPRVVVAEHADAKARKVDDELVARAPIQIACRKVAGIEHVELPASETRAR